jgi:hypothetical protein
MPGPGAGAQEVPRSPAERAADFESWIEADSARYDLRWQAAREYSRIFMLETDQTERRRLGTRAHEHARAATVLEPQGIEGHYRLAVASGQLADVDGGRAKIRWAKESWDESGWVLEADSLHAGAQFIRGRIHAGVQRTSPILRFLARVVLGADALAQTSWEGAIHHLERAAALEPDTPMHHFELAQAYRDRKRAEEMRQALQAAVAASGSGNPEVDEEYRRRARAELEESGR